MSDESINLVDKFNDLFQKKREADQAYYMTDTPVMSDAEYDLLAEEVEHLGKLIGADTSSLSVVIPSDQKVAHPSRMFSLTVLKLDDEKRIRSFGCAPTVDHSVECSLKVDGLSANLIYVDGVLRDILLRGDYFYGESVYKTISGIADVAGIDMSGTKGVVEIRGELAVTRDDFVRLNEERIAAGLPAYVDARNAAAGITRTKVTKSTPEALVSALEKLSLFTYDIVAPFIKSRPEAVQFLLGRGAKMAPHLTLVDTLKGIDDYYHSFITEADLMPVACDGIVVRVTCPRLQETLGYGSRTPNFAFAVKFPEKGLETRVLDVLFMVGRTGQIVPVVEFEPIMVQGVKVQRAKLGSYGLYETYQLKVGDVIEVQRSGDTIPHVVRKVRSGTHGQWKPITSCPSCHGESMTALTDPRTGKLTVLFCDNGDQCPSKINGKLLYLVSRDVLDIRGIGPRAIEYLTEDRHVASLEDLVRYALDSATHDRRDVTFAKAILKARKTTLVRFLRALAIPSIGEETCKDLAKNFGTLDRILQLSTEELKAFGLDADQLENWQAHLNDVIRFSATATLPVEEGGLGFVIDEHRVPKVVKDTRIAGLRFVITGTIVGYTRNQVKDFIVNSGGEVASTISKKVDIVIAGDNPGTTREIAAKMGIPLWTARDLISIMDGHA